MAEMELNTSVGDETWHRLTHFIISQTLPAALPPLSPSSSSLFSSVPNPNPLNDRGVRSNRVAIAPRLDPPVTEENQEGSAKGKERKSRSHLLEQRNLHSNDFLLI